MSGLRRQQWFEQQTRIDREDKVNHDLSPTTRDPGSLSPILGERRRLRIRMASGFLVVELGCSWTSPPEFGGCPYYRKISFLKGGDDFTPDRMNAFFRASERVKPEERH
jgi:hypothetical protein